MAISGMALIDARPSLPFFAIIIMTTAMRVTASGINVVTLFASTSFKEFTSPIRRARIFPVGLLSKNRKPRVWICSYNSLRIFTSTSFDTFAIRYIRSLIRRIKSTFSVIPRIPSLIKPSESLFLICTSMARSKIIGFNNTIVVVAAIRSITTAIVFL